MLIRAYDDPVLQAVAEPVTAYDKELRLLVKSLTLAMRSAAGGAGLAAPQLAVPLRVLVFDYDGRAGHLVNPRLELSGRTVTADEACLSAPGRWRSVERSFAATAKGRDMYGKPQTIRAIGMLARILQHEVDHLDGVLIPL